MAIEQHQLTDRAAWMALRERDVTASVAGAVLGVHEYQTPFGLWALKSGLAHEDPEESPAMRRGRLLEPVALQILAEDRADWRVIPANDVYWRDAAARIGATPDAYAIDPNRAGRGVVQVKTTSDLVFRRKWLDEDRQVQVPLWIAVQAIVEARLTGATWAAVAVLVVGHGLDLHVVDIPLHDGLWTRLVEDVATFWRGVEAGEPPAPDFGRDGETIAALYPPDEGAEPLDLSADNLAPALVDEREALSARTKADKARLDEIKAELTHKLAGHPIARLADGREITRTIQHRAESVVKATSFPVLRVRTPKRRAA